MAVSFHYAALLHVCRAERKPSALYTQRTASMGPGTLPSHPTSPMPTVFSQSLGPANSYASPESYPTSSPSGMAVGSPKAGMAVGSPMASGHFMPLSSVASVQHSVAIVNLTGPQSPRASMMAPNGASNGTMASGALTEYPLHPAPSMAGHHVAFPQGQVATNLGYDGSLVGRDNLNGSLRGSGTNQQAGDLNASLRVYDNQTYKSSGNGGVLDGSASLNASMTRMGSGGLNASFNRSNLNSISQRASTNLNASFGRSAGGSLMEAGGVSVSNVLQSVGSGGVGLAQRAMLNASLRASSHSPATGAPASPTPKQRSRLNSSMRTSNGPALAEHNSVNDMPMGPMSDGQLPRLKAAQENGQEQSLGYRQSSSPRWSGINAPPTPPDMSGAGTPSPMAGSPVGTPTYGSPQNNYFAQPQQQAQQQWPVQQQTQQQWPPQQQYAQQQYVEQQYAQQQYAQQQNGQQQYGQQQYGQHAQY